MRSTRREASLTCGVPHTAVPLWVCTDEEELGASWSSCCFLLGRALVVAQLEKLRLVSPRSIAPRRTVAVLEPVAAKDSKELSKALQLF